MLLLRLLLWILGEAQHVLLQFDLVGITRCGALIDPATDRTLLRDALTVGVLALEGCRVPFARLEQSLLVVDRGGRRDLDLQRRGIAHRRIRLQRLLIILLMHQLA